MPDRPPLILLPGLLCDETVFAHQVEALADVADVRVPNLYGFDSIVAMAQSVLDAAPACFALLGFSMGGRVALEVVRRAPPRVSHLVLMDTGVHPARPGEADQRQALIDLAYDRGMQAVADRWLPGMLHRADPAMRRSLEAMVCRASPEIHEQQLRALLERPDAVPVLRMIACPTLVLCGREDRWSTFEQHQAIAAGIPGAELAAVEDAGHFCSVEQPVAFTQLVRDWLLRNGFGRDRAAMEGARH